MKSRGLREDPCGMPHIKSKVADSEPLKETDWVLSARKKAIHDNARPSIP